jgi:hypothetical protein
MVGHQAVSQDRQTVQEGVFEQELKIPLAMSIFEEDVFMTVTALGQVVRDTRDDNSCASRHWISLWPV